MSEISKLIAAVALSLTIVLIGHCETIAGRFQYADFDPASGMTRLEPIRFCRVEVWAFRPRGFLGIWTWAKDADTTTDGNGAIAVGRTFQVPGVIYGVRIMAENYGAKVWPNQPVSTAQFYQEPGEPDGGKFERTANNPGDILDFSYDFTDSWTPQHWSLAETVRHGFDYVSARRDPSETDPLPQAGVLPGASSTFYNNVEQRLWIENALVFEDYTVLHEYGHFVEDHIGSFAPIPTQHDGCAATVLGVNVNSAEHAWMEGFADFFAQVVVANNPPGTFQGHPGDFGTPTVSELETPPFCAGLPSNVTPDMIENNVAAVLWDLFDPVGACGSNEAHDNLAGFDSIIIQILDHEMELPWWPTIFDFRDAWLARGLPAEPLFEILRHHGIAAPPAPTPTLVCPGDITVTAGPNQCAANVSFSLPALSPARRCATVQCNWQSGQSFPLGTTTVNCTATEGATIIASCGFTITVNPDHALPDPQGTGLLGIYYDNADFTTPKLARIEAVDFDWGGGAPAPGVDAETFSVRWSGQVVPRFTDTYTFYTVSDDGARLWVNGQLVIDDWNDHPATEHHGLISLEAGVAYDIVMEMYENSGTAVAKLLWSCGCQAKEIIPATQLLPGRLECPSPPQPTYPRDRNPQQPPFRLFGDARFEVGWLKLTTANNSYGVAYVDNFSGSQPVFGFQATFKAALFGSLCCNNGLSPADGFSFNLVPAATVLANPGYGQPAEEGLDEGLAIDFDTWDNGGGEAPAIEVKWLGQLVGRVMFQASQSPAGIRTADAAAREVVISLSSDGKLSLSYGGVPIFNNLQTPYSPNVIGTPEWVLGARNGAANDNHWIRDLRIVVNPPSIPLLYNTGVDGNRRPLADNAPDPHYLLVPGSPIVGTPVAATASGGFPIGPWLSDDSASAWISPTPSTYGPAGLPYRYETSFDLKGLNPAGAGIYGWVAADDSLADILVNGVSTGQGTPPGPLSVSPFSYWQPFAITSGLQPGINTITFVVQTVPGNYNPTGLRVQMCGWAESPPQLKLTINHTQSETTLSWGSLPQKTYFLEHASNLGGPWIREPLGGVAPGTYEGRWVESHPQGPVEPVRFYRLMEVPESSSCPF